MWLRDTLKEPEMTFPAKCPAIRAVNCPKCRVPTVDEHSIRMIPRKYEGRGFGAKKERKERKEKVNTKKKKSELKCI